MLRANTGYHGGTEEDSNSVKVSVKEDVRQGFFRVGDAKIILKGR